MRRTIPVGLALAFVVLAGALTAPAAASSVTVVASGLDNPRGVAIGPNGAIYVAEAGRGGAGPCFGGPEGGQVCLGQSGAITRLWRDEQMRIVVGLPSVAAPDGSSAIGPVDVGLLGTGQLYATIGLGADPAIRSAPGVPAFARQFGNLVRVNGARGTWTSVADVSAFEAANNPDSADPGSHVDSNPYGLLVTPNGRIVADAGGNDLLRVSATGEVSLLSVFPARFVSSPFGTIPMQAVPTSVVVGPGGDYYVGQLTGFPFPVGGANIYRVPREGGSPTVFASGFTNIIDIAFGGDGSLYVLEIAHNGLLSGDPTGALIRVRPNGTRETLPIAGLVMPGGFAIAADGSFYITNFSVAAGAGQLIRFAP
ncbi:MAG: ScyD/ScyE family protein [Chloroflexota bacterium]